MTVKRLAIGIGVVALVAIGVVVTSQSAEAILLQGTFVDDNQSPHQNGIEAVAALKITAGCNPPANDRFCPERTMSRAEAATFIARAYNLPDDGNDYFVDDDGHPLESGINRIAAAGITAGCNPPANDRFCPDRDLTRAQFATFIVRAENLPATSVDYFVDDQGHVLEGAINRIAEARITVGCNPPENNRFCPDRTLSRGETATFLTRALSLDHNPQEIPMTNWTPVTCNKDGLECRATVQTFSGRTHRIEEGLFQILPYGAGEQAEFLGGGTSFTLELDGSPIALTELPLETTSTKATRLWDTRIVFSEGVHLLVGEWRRGGVLVQRTTVTLDVG